MEQLYNYINSDSRFVYDADEFTLQLNLNSVDKLSYPYNPTGSLAAELRQRISGTEYKSKNGFDAIITNDGSYYQSIKYEGITIDLLPNVQIVLSTFTVPNLGITSSAYIINKATIMQYEDVAINVEERRLQVFIKKAQDLDLKPFMGNIFFYDFMNSFNPDGTFKFDAPQYYIDLFEGVEYKDRNGNNLYFDGIKPALVYWTFARFIEADSFRYTATGPVIKQHDEADTLKPADIAKLVQQQRSTANAHVNDIINYLDNKRDVYTKWRYNERNTQSRQPGPRIRGVDRTDVRRVYGPNSNFPYGPNGFLDGLIG